MDAGTPKSVVWLSVMASLLPAGLVTLSGGIRARTASASVLRGQNTSRASKFHKLLNIVT